MLSNKILYGLSRDGLEQRQQQWLAPATWRALALLQAAAAERGFDVQLASAHRGFERQLAIWNAKARGLRPVLDSDGQVLDISKLNERELVLAILRWSALPGASRHHWGCDFDIYDRAALGDGQSFELLSSECERGGVFAPMYRWLAGWLSKQSDFYRPYAEDLGGVAPEPWHLSYVPLACDYMRAFDRRQLRELLQHSEFELKNIVVDMFDEIVERFVLRTAEVPCADNF
ncbi:M15 family metallopeptidase [Agaribacterium haliotis]|uniref:M15 family metallopeptidase n=1 Tax=Agaribacterium haliotis TaxID=2013869 RepID=UPI000BB59E43|nr:M15 family metallopeptidase [Agaribacterium haliotis]